MPLGRRNKSHSWGILVMVSPKEGTGNHLKSSQMHTSLPLTTPSEPKFGHQNGAWIGKFPQGILLCIPVWANIWQKPHWELLELQPCPPERDLYVEHSCDSQGLAPPGHTPGAPTVPLGALLPFKKERSREHGCDHRHS